MESLIKFESKKFHVWEYKDHNTWPKHEFKLTDDPFDFLGQEYVTETKQGGFTIISNSNNGLTTEENYLKNYANKMTAVSTNRVIACVDKSEDKVSLKIFEYLRHRNVGVSYFRVSTKCRYITFNHKTNSLYVGQITNYHKKRKFSRNVRRNFFCESPINRMRGMLSDIITRESIKKTNDLITVSDEVNNIINTFLDAIPGIEKYGLLKDDYRLYKRFLDYSGVKYSNNWNVFMTSYPQPTKKILRKHKFKYIDAFMAMSDVNGDKIKRVLHKVSHCDFNTLKFSYKIFGKNFTLSQDDEIIKTMIENSLMYVPEIDIEFNNKEKHNAFSVFKSVLSGHIDMSTYTDHLNFYRTLNTFEVIRWKSHDYDSFMNEHYEWSEKQGFYTQGDVVRNYPEKFKKAIERPILGVGDVYIPVLLTESKEYNRESAIQSNCVKTYIKREQSIIISLRKGERDSIERATIEYKIVYKKHGVDKLERVQSLGRFNNKLEDSWEPQLKILDKLINDLVIDGVFELPTVDYKVGGETYNIKLIVGDETLYDNTQFYLKWDNPIINMVNTNVRRINNNQELHLLLDEF